MIIFKTQDSPSSRTINTFWIKLNVLAIYLGGLNAGRKSKQIIPQIHQPAWGNQWLCYAQPKLQSFREKNVTLVELALLKRSPRSTSLISGSLESVIYKTELLHVRAFLIILVSSIQVTFMNSKLKWIVLTTNKDWRKMLPTTVLV